MKNIYWTHGNRSLTYTGNADFGDAAILDSQLASDFIDFRTDFFERVFDGKTGQADSAPMKVFIMGNGSGRRNNAGRLDHGEAWQGFADWPPTEAEVRLYYLASNGQLATDARPSASRIDYCLDPLKPVPTLSGAELSGEPVMRGGASDPIRCFVLQLSEVRRQSEYEGTVGAIAAGPGRD